ncbi:alpha/beta hydrolase [Actinomadura rudentiformis]|uniref:alpha/beta hydrolase n=1 Tax=Actinomadura rudentiformis TaxID=359158 RepID=UPI00178C35D5|nr:alpha/beta hydrolase family protein [Actinomadura rudentiformis]
MEKHTKRPASIKRRSIDKKIAIASGVAIAVTLSGSVIAIAQTGAGGSEERPQAAAGTPTPPSIPGNFVPGPESMASPPPVTSPNRKPPSNPFSTGRERPAPNDPDLRGDKRGAKPKMPKAKGLPGFKPADSGAKITKLEKVGASLYDVTIATPALGTEVKTRVLFPKSWKSKTTKTWPVVYAFHGGNNRYTSWTKDSNIRQVAAGHDVMVVMPEGGWNGSYTNWWNDGKGGIPQWENFHIKEVIPLMERNFHAGSSRAAIGLSSGGQGAITYAQRYRGLFKYAASYSGALNITAPGMPTVFMQLNAAAGDDIWGDPVRDRANWKAHDATVMVSRLKGVGVYVSSGDGRVGPYDDPDMEPLHAGRVGEQFSGYMATRFVNAAKQAGVPITANLYGPGTHKWAYWKRELVRSWPAITAAIGATKVGVRDSE